MPALEAVGAYAIDQDRCINCWWCRRECPTGAILFFERPERAHWIDAERCIDCGICARVCPMRCIAHIEYRHDPERLEEARRAAREFARARRQREQARLSATASEQPLVQFLQRLQELGQRRLSGDGASRGATAHA